MAGAFSHSNTMESNTVVVSMSLKIKNGKAVGVPQQLIHMAVMTETFTTNIPTLGDTAIDRMIKWLQYHMYIHKSNNNQNCLAPVQNQVFEF